DRLADATGSTGATPTGAPAAGRGGASAPPSLPASRPRPPGGRGERDRGGGGAPPPPSRQASGQSPQEGMVKRILVVEDESKIARLVRDYLEHAGFEVVVAGDGEVALAEARRSRPALV